MIGPSQRRRPGGPPPLELHRRLARGYAWQRRLAAGAFVALAASAFAWVAGLHAPGHAVALVVGWVAGAALPVRRAEEWALAWIRQHEGLAYETALERRTTDDPYGLAAATTARAEVAAVRVEPPSQPAWWLAALALALGLFLIPALPVGSPATTGGGPPGAPTSQAPPPAAEEEEKEVPAAEVEEEAPSRVAAPGRGADADRPAGGSTERTANSDREALDRYLQNLRERPAEERQPDGPAGEPTPSERAGQAPREPRPGAADPDRRAGDEQGERAERGAASQAGEGQGEERQGEQAAGEGGEQAPGESGEEAPGESGDAQGEQGGETGEDPAGGGELEDPGAQQPDDAATGGAAPAPGAAQGGEEEGPDPADGGRGGEEAGGAGAGAEAGTGPSDPSLPGAAVEGAGDLEFLPGRLGEGPLNPGGEVQLPGTQEGTLPPGATPEGYLRAVERAVTEGRIPVEYQEIIRNYFR